MLFLEQAGVVTMPRQLRELLSASEIRAGWTDIEMPNFAAAHVPLLMLENKIYAGYARRRAHALWLSLSQPNSREI